MEILFAGQNAFDSQSTDNAGAGTVMFCDRYQEYAEGDRDIVAWSQVKESDEP
jgi:hypothetical protein